MNEKNEDVVKRLDALIMLEISRMKRELASGFNLQEPAKILKASGFSPSEIASILNKKGPTAVAYLLYDKKMKDKDVNNAEK